MKVRVTALAVFAALLATGAAATAHAETLKPIALVNTAATANTTPASPLPQFTNEAQPWAAPAPRKTLQFDTKGRWGLRLDMDQLSNRETQWKDVAAGAFFRITPSLRVGGSVALTDKMASPQKVTPQDATPRVHLETAFRF
jgi:hypothetical protein